MIRGVAKVITYYSPNADDMKVCAMCRDGWAFKFSDGLGAWVHEIQVTSPPIICRAVNDLSKVTYKRLLAEAA